MSLDRFDELFEKYSDGDLNAADRAEFLRLLETPEGRARFAEVSSYEAALSEELRVAAAAEKGVSSRTLPKVGSRRVPILKGAEHDESKTLAYIASLAAAAVVVILTVVFATSSKPLPPTPVVNRVLPPVPKPEPRVAEAPKPEPPAPVPAPAPQPVVDPLVPVPPKPPKRKPAPPPVVDVPKPAPVVPAAPSVPAPKPDEERPRESATFVATVDQVSGEARMGRDAAVAGKGVAAGETLSTGRDGYLSIRYPDGSRVELAGDTTLNKVADGPAGKAAQLDAGMIFVDAVKQPAGRPMVISTVQADATVLGTQFVLSASAGLTRLDVREGRVKFTRMPDGVSSVVVRAGHYATAGGAGDLASRSGVGLWKPPGAGLQMWLKADAGTKLSGTTVAAWLDQSMGGNSAQQDKPGSQPLYVPNAFGGRPTIRFDGSDDFLVLPDGFSDFRLGLTAFVVTRPAAGGAWSRFIDLDVGPACENIVFGRKDSPDKLGFWVYSNSSTKGKVEAPGVVAVDQVQVFCARLEPSGRVTLYKNGAAVGAGETTMPKSVTRKPNGIAKSNSGGGDPAFKGDIFEILLYNRGLTEAERVYVETYLNAKYLDPATPPQTLRAADK